MDEPGSKIRTSSKQGDRKENASSTSLSKKSFVKGLAAKQPNDPHDIALRKELAEHSMNLADDVMDVL